VHLWPGPERRAADGHTEIVFPGFPSCAPELEQEIRRVNAGLVVIDPLAAYFDSNIETNNDANVRRALAALSGVAERTGAAILVVRHLTKDESKRAIPRGGGSIGIIGAVRSAFVIAKHPQDEMLRVFACTKMNLAAFPTKSLVFRVTTDPVFDCAHINWEGELVMSADDLLASTAISAGFS
jgi:hypothetical protein